MEPSPKHKYNKAHTDNMEAPPLPCRWKMMQKTKSDQNTVATLKSNDSAATDTDTEYEYVSNPTTKRNSSKGCNIFDKQGQEENENHRNVKDHRTQPSPSINADTIKAAADADCGGIGILDSNSIYASNESDKLNHDAAGALSMHDGLLIRIPQQRHRVKNHILYEGGIISSGDEAKVEDTAGVEGTTNYFDHDFPKCRNPGKGTASLHLTSDDDIHYKAMSQQDICCLHERDKNNDGYQKLINATMEPPFQKHEYQKLNKLTMEPRLGDALNPQREPQCNKCHTIWRKDDWDINC